MLSETARTIQIPLDAIFLLLCVRFQVAAILSAQSDFAPALLLVIGGLLLGFCDSYVGLNAFTLVVPLLNGLGQSSLLGCDSPPSLVFSALCTGIASRSLTNATLSFRSTAPSDRLSKGGQYQDTSTPHAEPLMQARSIFARTPITAPFTAGISFSSVSIGILIFAVTVSLIAQTIGNGFPHEFWSAFINRAAFGYGDRWYYITSAYIWLQGFYYFKYLLAFSTGPNVMDTDRSIGKIAFPKFLLFFLFSYVATMLFFVFIQFKYHLPESWIWTGAGFQSPYEDISSFGSIAVILFILTVTILPRCSVFILLFYIIGALSGLFLVIASWSRAAWLACFVFSFFAVLLRISRYWARALLCLGFISAIVLNVTIKNPPWMSQPYLARLLTLVRIEDPSKKSIERINLYKKAIRMIERRPYYGFGIGSFYLTSVKFAERNDPQASWPDFAHDVFLQIAAEEGIPVAILFAGFCTWVLATGLKFWFRARSIESSSPNYTLLLLGVTLAIGAYLQTQLTANSLNVYSSNQFVFWFLVAAVLILSREDACERTLSR